MEQGGPTFKNTRGLRRILNAIGFSLAGLRAAVRHEPSFRQELAVGIPLLLAVPWLAQGPIEALLMAGSVLLVWVAELFNSALEALADAVSTAQHPLIGRAKDIGSAAVMLCVVLAGMVWGVLLWPRLGL
ncbi:MAG TPA: diacylglycerol kinase [Rubrivivax sp.]|nr:diacylglycerol kinase [Rubrivivax sp.]